MPGVDHDTKDSCKEMLRFIVTRISDHLNCAPIPKQSNEQAFNILHT